MRYDMVFYIYVQSYQNFSFIKKGSIAEDVGYPWEQYNLTFGS